MSLAGHSTLREQALSLQGLLDADPHFGAGIVHRQQELGLFGDVLEVPHQLAACRARAQVRFLFLVPATLNDVGQDLLKLLAIHGFFILSQLRVPGPEFFRASVHVVAARGRKLRLGVLPSPALNGGRPSRLC